MSDPKNECKQAQAAGGSTIETAPKQNSYLIASFLLQPEPEALLSVRLVKQPTMLPIGQFEALLVDSECEV